MLSLEERIEQLERDLTADPIKISAYHDLPFAILRYHPEEEFQVRKQIALFVTRLENAGKRVHVISLARLMWRAVKETEGIEGLVAVEKSMGFQRAQETLSVILSDDAFMPLSTMLEEELKGLDPKVDVVFLVRVGALAPATYRSAKLLDEMYGRTMVPMILFYPGTLEGDRGLRFMDLPGRGDTGAYNYRVRIY